ncbi:MAG: lipopolysaccharide kinase InaA family protein [Lentisphaeria bacterium]|nr:lipopolysaccharide kinase InaA family protein [Lentisphaeria bacterium]
MTVHHSTIQEIVWFGETGCVAAALSLPETVVKENKQRRVSALGEPAPRFYLKRDKTHGWQNRFKRLFRDRIQTEFKTGTRLKQAGVPVVEHVAWGRRGTDSYLLTQAFDGEPLTAFWRRIKGNRDAENELITALTELLTRFFRQSFYHPDLHGGNILVKATEASLRLHFVDVYGVRRQRLTTARLITMLVFVLLLMDHRSETDQKEVLSRFLDFFPGSTPADLFYHVSRAWIQRLYKWRRTRLSKYLKSSSACDSWDTAQGQVIARRESGREVITTLFAECDRDHTFGNSSRVIHSETGGERYMIERFDGWPSPGRQAWLTGVSLEIMGVPAVKNLAWLRGATTGWIIMEDPDGKTLADILSSDAPISDKHSRLAAAARLVLRLYRRGIAVQGLDLSEFIVTPHHELIIGCHDHIRIGSSPPSGARHDQNLELFLYRVCEQSEKHGLPLPEGVSPAQVKNDPLASLNILARIADV